MDTDAEVCGACDVHELVEREVLEVVGGPEARALVTLEYDAATDQLVQSWPAELDDSRGRELGLPADANLESMVRAYVEMINQ